MAIKLGATGITFHDNSVQTTAGGPVVDQYAIGSYVLGRPQNSTSYNNSTIAGSSLYATNNAYANNVAFESPYTGWLPYSVSYGGGARETYAQQSLVNTGSWRCVSLAGGSNNSGTYTSYGNVGLWVRYA
jgi:hypothetical protein